ncbi:hypothetical protein ASD65_06230 [Microbacterium sp. Root61]|uniref:hypothetical protein n=1 Tax=Microbacterium sp. Root61 TaxID=1736570 RepID=UPI0006F7939B|nr:hypothetical protein [Microbacterium sp. Root61]KRA24066.1 hypothetical protein ASD65_06230 [Microbacterium sp. Root61]
MYFSEHYGIAVDDETEWFDPLLDIDTPLFVDPFLVYAEEEGFWEGSADIIAGHFERGFTILAGHHESPASLQYKKTVDLMKFPEPGEFGLGVTAKSTDGSGGGSGLARQIVRAMSIAIERGLQDLRRFEELGVLVERIGRDRISDITCNILKYRFIEYTQQVARDNAIPMSEFRVKNAGFDELRKRWEPKRVQLPANPLNGKPVLLTPKRFLRELPTLNADDWWEYVEPGLRDDLNLDIGARLRKADIVALARQHTDLVRAWTEARAEQAPEPYDVNRDPEGLHDAERRARGIVDQLDIPSAPDGAESLTVFIKNVTAEFKHYVEEEGGWPLLYNEKSLRPKREAAVQQLYKAVVKIAGVARGVHIDREVEFGRGPVDFVFTEGPTRFLLEIKKLRNGKFWNGLRDQLTSYMESAECDNGWFLAVRYADTPTERARTQALPQAVQDLRADTGLNVHFTLVDARPKQSASNLDGVTDGTYVGAEDDEDGLD